MRVFIAFILFLFAVGPIGGLYMPVGVCHAQTVQIDNGKVSLVIGFGPKTFFHVDPKEAKAVVDLYISELGNSLNIETRTVVYSDIDSIITDLKAERLDMVTTSNIEYHRISHIVETELAYTLTANGRKKKKSILLVRNDSGIEEIIDLKNKKLGISSSDTIGLMFTDTVLLRNNQSPADQYFSKIIKERKQSTIIMDLFFKKFDACLVNDWAFSAMSELNPQIQKQLKIIIASPYILRSTTFFRKNLRKEIKDIIKKAAVRMASSVYGQQLLMIVKSDNIAKLDSADLDSFNQLFNEYEELMRRWNHLLNTQ